MPIIVIKRTRCLFLELKCTSKWSNGSIVRNFNAQWNKFPFTIMKGTPNTKFIQKVIAEILKRQKSVAIDRRVARFNNLFGLNYHKKTEI